MKSNNSKAKEIIRFVLTGGVCFLVELLFLVLLKEVCGLDTLIATPIAFLVSVVINYILCVKWVFEGNINGNGAEKLGFLVTSLIGLLLNELFMFLFRVIWGEETELLHMAGFTVSLYMMNKALSTLLVMIWNYFTKRAILQSGIIRRMIEKMKRSPEK